MHQIDGEAVSIGKFETPHYKVLWQAGLVDPSLPAPHTDDTNQDYSLFVPGVGLFIADGVGTNTHADLASRTVVHAVARRARQLELNERTPEVVMEATQLILAEADNELARLQSWQEPSTTLGAILLAGAAIGIGDTPAFRYNPKKDELTWLTQEQCQGRYLLNYMNGGGRPPAEGDARPPDQIIPVPLKKGNIYGVLSDGFTGDFVRQRISDRQLIAALQRCIKAKSTAAEIVKALVELPTVLYQQGATVEDGQLYTPKIDDLSVGIIVA